MQKHDKDLVPSKREDTLLSAVKALAAAVPPLGGPLSSVLSDLQAMRKEARVIELLDGVKADLEDRIEQINTDFVSKAEFLDILEQTAGSVAKTMQEKKRQAFKHVLTNCMLSSDVTYDEVEEFLSLLERLKVEDMFVLSILNNPVKYDERTGDRVGKGGGLFTSINQIMGQLLPDWDEQAILEVLSRLEGERLAQNMFGRYKTLISDRGIHHLTNTLTAKGTRLCKFILAPDNGA